MEVPSSDRWRVPLGVLFTGSGIAHFARPSVFASIVPPLLGQPLPWVYASGVAELGCAAGLLLPGATSRRRWAYASAALLVGVFPANLWMAWQAFSDPHASAAYRALTLARLPMQVPLIVAALSVARAQSHPAAAD